MLSVARIGLVNSIPARVKARARGLTRRTPSEKQKVLLARENGSFVSSKLYPQELLTSFARRGSNM